MRTKYLYVGGIYQSQFKGKQPTLVEKSDGSFELVTSSGNREIYDAQGRLTLKQDSRGNGVSISYDSRGRLPLTGSSPFSLKPAEPMVVSYDYRLTKVEERLADGTLTGQAVTFTYDDSSGRLLKINANDGREVTYQHDLTTSAKNGNLLRVDGLEDIDSIYEYNDAADSHNVTSIRHGAATDTPYINEYYADTGKVKKQTYGLDTYEFVYNPLQTITTHKIYTSTGTLATSATITSMATVFRKSWNGYSLQGKSTRRSWFATPQAHWLRRKYCLNGTQRPVAMW
jgi:YD repeat-containing protein